MGWSLGRQTVTNEESGAPFSVRNAVPLLGVVRPHLSTSATVVVYVLADVLVILASILLAIVVRSHLLPALSGLDAFAPVRNYWSLWPAILLLLGGRAAVGLYPGFGLHPAEELRRQTWITVCLAIVVLAGAALFQFAEVYSRIVLLGTAALLVILLPMGRAAVKALLARSGTYGRPVWVFGTDDRAVHIANLLLAHQQLGLRPMGVGTELPTNLSTVNTCVVVPDGMETPLAATLDLVGERFRRVWLVPSFLDIGSVWVTPRDLDGHLALELRNNLLEPRSQLTKRALDLVLALVLLVPAAFVGLLIALAIRLEGRGPVLFLQKRVGKGSSAFHIFKFRTMVVNAPEVLEAHLEGTPGAMEEWNRARKLVDDPRITRVGRFLRRTSLDELPQIMNILRGQMSFVGPRPTMPDEACWYGNAERLLVQVLPGLTGLMQVSGRSDLTYEERIRLDTYYVRNWSIWLDLVILGRTFGTVVTGRGAY